MQLQSHFLQAKNPSSPHTMASFYTVIFAVALLLEFTTSSTMALPKMKMDEESIDQDKVLAITEDEMSENAPGPLTFRRHPIIEGRLVNEDGIKQIFILADTEMKGSPGREASVAFSRIFSMLPPRGMDHVPNGFSMRDERRSADDVMPMGRRDIDMLRCMIGRVYRPCWQA